LNHVPAPALRTGEDDDAVLDADIAARARGVRLLVLDVDGVLTDGRLYYASGGDEAKAFHIQDGLGIKLLQGTGVVVAIITGRRSAALERRARELGIGHLTQGAEDKLAAFERLAGALSVAPAQVACVGDDLPDLPMIRRCGLGVTVPDAPALLRRHAHYLTRRRGGEGAVREVCDLLMQAQGTLADALREFLA
jgi:3-deoxy-D-manno-octulosonate 8-phosphate phosphatase (KDO 8-P phosphatase)